MAGEITITGDDINADHEHIALSKRAHPDVQVGTVVRLLRNGEIVAEWRTGREIEMEVFGDCVQPPRRQHTNAILADIIKER